MPRLEPRLSGATPRWHVHVDGQTYGPYTEREIQKMIAGQQIVSSDLVYREGGSAWQQLASDAILGEPIKRSNSPPKPRRDGRKSAPRQLLYGALVILVLGWVTWPYYALYDLAVGAKAGDVAILEARVDWARIREGLRGDLNAMFLQSMKTEVRKQKDDSGAALGQGLAVMLGPVIIDRMVDAYVTPQAIAAEVRSEKTISGPSIGPPATQNAQSPVLGEPPAGTTSALAEPVQRIRQSEIKYAFFSGNPFTFLVEVVPKGDQTLQQPIGLRFQWEGAWKLTRIVLPPDMVNGLSAAAKSAGASSGRDQ